MINSSINSEGERTSLTWPKAKVASEHHSLPLIAAEGELLHPSDYFIVDDAPKKKKRLYCKMLPSTSFDFIEFAGAQERVHKTSKSLTRVLDPNVGIGDPRLPS